MEWTQERLDTLAASVESLTAQQRDFERTARLGLDTLTELFGDTQREVQKLAKSISALADHSSRLDKLEGE